MDADEHGYNLWGKMNWIHGRLCRSEWWRKKVRRELLPWVLRGLDLGDYPLEIGSGPGLTSEVLRLKCTRLTCLEIDPILAAALAARLGSGNVTVQQGDASAMPFQDSTFTGAACFTMLHHVPSVQLQDRILKEACRVIRPGSWLAGSDSKTSLTFRLIHIGDTMVVCDADEFGERLVKAGFSDVSVVQSERAFSFRGRKPVSA